MLVIGWQDHTILFFNQSHTFFQKSKWWSNKCTEWFKNYNFKVLIHVQWSNKCVRIGTITLPSSFVVSDQDLSPWAKAVRHGLGLRQQNPQGQWWLKRELKFFAGSLELANWSILAPWRLFKEVVGKKIRILC